MRTARHKTAISELCQMKAEKSSQFIHEVVLKAFASTTSPLTVSIMSAAHRITRHRVSRFCHTDDMCHFHQGLALEVSSCSEPSGQFHAQ